MNIDSDDLSYARSTAQARDVLFLWLAGTPAGTEIQLSNGWVMRPEDFYGGPGIEIISPEGDAFVAIVEEAELREDDPHE